MLTTETRMRETRWLLGHRHRGADTGQMVPVMLPFILLLLATADGLLFVTEPSSGVALLNSPHWFHCQADVAGVSYLWRFGERDVPSSETGDWLVSPNGTLLVRDATEGTVGNYTCIATDGNSTISSAMAQLQLASGPEFTRRPENATAEEGSDVTLPCQATGRPSPVLQWITPQSVILPVSTTAGRVAVNVSGTLTITNVTSQDQGRYTCFVSNDVSSLIAVVILTVQGPPHFTKTPMSRVALQGEKTTFSCHTAGYPPPTLTWYRGDQWATSVAVQADARVLLSPYGDLTLATVRLEDDGTYRCVATSPRGQVTAFAVLTVHVLPVFVETPASARVSVGQSVELRCRVTGVPVPSLRWARDGATLALDDNMSVSPDHTLTIRSIRSDQLGQYACVARNQAGQATSTASIHLSAWSRSTGQPHFTLQPLNATANATAPLTLSCRAADASSSASSSPSPGSGGAPEAVLTSLPVMRWHRALRDDGADILIDVVDSEGEGGGGGGARYWATKEGDMVFERMTGEDEGWYYCTAARGQTLVYSTPVFIDVKVPPVITTISNPPATPELNPVDLTCSAVADPDPEVTWRSPEGSEVTASEAGYGLAEGRLRISEATNQKDGGTWTCLACNMLGCDSADTELGIIGTPFVRDVSGSKNEATVTLMCGAVGRPASLVTYGSDLNATVLDTRGTPFVRDVSGSRNETTVTLQCGAVGLPAPLVTYGSDLNATVLDTRGHLQVGGRLYVGRDWLRPRYTCTASNQHGDHTVNMTAPYAAELRGATATSRSVTLTVDAAGSLGALPLLGVTAEFRTSDVKTWTSRFIALETSLDTSQETSQETSQPSAASDSVRQLERQASRKALTEQPASGVVSAAEQQSVLGTEQHGRSAKQPASRSVSTTEQPASGSMSTTRQPASVSMSTTEQPASGSLSTIEQQGSVPANEQQPPKSVSANEQQSSESASGNNEQQTPESASANAQQPPESVSASEQQPPETVSASEQQPPETVSASKQQPPESVSASEEQPPESVSASEQQPPESVSASEQQPPESVSANNEQQTPENVSANEQQTPENVSALEQRGSLTGTTQQQELGAGASAKRRRSSVAEDKEEEEEEEEKDRARSSGVGTLGSPAGSLEVRVAELQPFSVYYVRVMLVNALGEGPVSLTSVRLATLPDAPPPPTDVMVTSQNREIVVTWTAPQHLNDNKDNVHFEVVVFNTSGLAVSQTSVQAPQPPQVTVGDLDLGNHSVSVATFNSALQLQSENVTIQMEVAQAVPVFVPNVTSVRALSDVSLALTWQTPEDPASVLPPVEGYRLRVQQALLPGSPLELDVNGSGVSSHNVSGLRERTRYSCSVAAFNLGGVGRFSAPVDVLTFYGLFSDAAYQPDDGLVTSGLWVGVLGGVIGGLVFVVLALFLFRQLRRLHQANSLDLLRPSHGLDPLYLENPKGLHPSSHRNTGWLKGLGVYRLFGTNNVSSSDNNVNNNNISNNNNNNNNNNNSSGTSDNINSNNNSNNSNTSSSNTNNNDNSSNSINNNNNNNDDNSDNNRSNSFSSGVDRAADGVAGMGVAVVTMETPSSGTTPQSEERGETVSRPWWRRMRLLRATSWRFALPSLRRNKRVPRLNIQHPHFSGQGATVTTTVAAAVGASPSATCNHHHQHHHRQHHHHHNHPAHGCGEMAHKKWRIGTMGDEDLGDEFDADGVSLSSLSDSLTTVSMEADQQPALCSSSPTSQPAVSPQRGQKSSSAAAASSSSAAEAAAPGGHGGNNKVSEPPEEEAEAEAGEDTVGARDGESVYHILRRLDQDLEAFMGAEAADTGLLSDPEGPGVSTDTSEGAVVKSERRSSECALDSISFESDDSGAQKSMRSPIDSGRFLKDGKDASSIAGSLEPPQDSRNFLKDPSGVQRPDCIKEGSGTQITQEPSSDRASTAQGSLQPCVKEIPSSSTISFTSSSLYSRFNAQLDGYDINPLSSPSLSASAAPAEPSTGLYGDTAISDNARARVSHDTPRQSSYRNETTTTSDITPARVSHDSPRQRSHQNERDNTSPIPYNIPSGVISAKGSLVRRVFCAPPPVSSTSFTDRRQSGVLGELVGVQDWLRPRHRPPGTPPTRPLDDGPPDRPPWAFFSLHEKTSGASRGSYGRAGVSRDSPRAKFYTAQRNRSAKATTTTESGDQHFGTVRSLQPRTAVTAKELIIIERKKKSNAGSSATPDRQFGSTRSLQLHGGKSPMSRHPALHGLTPVTSPYDGMTSPYEGITSGRRSASVSKGFNLPKKIRAFLTSTRSERPGGEKTTSKNRSALALPWPHSKDKALTMPTRRRYEKDTAATAMPWQGVLQDRPWTLKESKEKSRSDRSSSVSSGGTASTADVDRRWKETQQPHTRQGLVRHSSLRVGGPPPKQDVLFGTNNVGWETANLY